MNKKKVSPAVIILIAIVVLSAVAEELPGDTGDALLGLLVLLLPIYLVISLSRWVGKKRSENVHTHDRIDHSRDLTIDRTTGKTTSAVAYRPQHSPKEHWKQQLDTLLANGTIDKSEYRAMMNRKF